MTKRTKEQRVDDAARTGDAAKIRKAIKAYKTSPEGLLNESLVPGFNILTDARTAISKRGAAYGRPQENLQDIAMAWGKIFGTDVSAQQVALAMIELKLIRLRRDPKHLDSLVDICGYAALCACLIEE